MPQPERQREFALEIVTRLRAAGFDALWAGGCVRDELLGLLPKDYDVATNATPEQIRNTFGRRRTLTLGAAFGVVTVLGPRRAGQIEVATFRTDAAYSDGRRPDSVSFTDAEHDARRRDFTINGLFYDPVAGKVVDYVGGQHDLHQRVVRAIGDARLRFSEDKLRMLRAVRFASMFAFQVEPATFRAIQQMAAGVTTVSAERIGMEIRRMLLDPNRAAALQLLADTNLLPHVLPEVACLDADTFDETKRRLNMLHEPSLAVALAALLSTQPSEGTAEPRHEGPPLTARDPSLTCAGPSSPAASVGRRLRYTNKEIDRANWLLQHLALIGQAQHIPWPQLQRILIHDGAAELMALREAIAGTDDTALAYCRERLAWPPERLNPPPLVDGSDLIGHGLAPGPQFALLLEQIRDAQLNRQIHTRDQALALADRLRTGGQPLP
jgi:tRNA nucleotidyltransferase/poly(A) polymerase